MGSAFSHGSVITGVGGWEAAQERENGEGTIKPVARPTPISFFFPAPGSVFKVRNSSKENSCNDVGARDGAWAWEVQPEVGVAKGGERSAAERRILHCFKARQLLPSVSRLPETTWSR